MKKRVAGSTVTVPVPLAEELEANLAEHYSPVRLAAFPI